MTHTVTVADVHQMTPDVKQFRLVSENYTFEYDPGQHTVLHFEMEGEEMTRPYTAATLPGDGTEELILAIKRYEEGHGSVYMHERTPGDEIEIEDVGGNLYVRDFDRDAAFLATGTGITALYPMLRHYAREGSGDAHFLFGERDQRHLIFRESLDQLRTERGNVAVDYVLSDPTDERAWNGRTGHVQEHLPEALAVDRDEADCYVCGVPEMVVETRDLLAEAGVDEDRIYTEGWEADAAGE